MHTYAQNKLKQATKWKSIFTKICIYVEFNMQNMQLYARNMHQYAIDMQAYA